MHVSAAIWYNLAQTGVYAIMAIGIMRLKLFFTPHLCILAGLMAKEKVTAKISRPVKFLFLLLFPPFIAGKKFKLYECTNYVNQTSRYFEGFIFVVEKYFANAIIQSKIYLYHNKLQKYVSQDLSQITVTFSKNTKFHYK